MTKGPFRIGEWLVDPSRNRLTRDGVEVRVEPKAMDVLLGLARTPREVVETEELIKVAWGDRPMGDNPVYKCIAQLRKALGDNLQSPEYIETIPRKGYRLVAEVTAAASADAPDHATPVAGKTSTHAASFRFSLLAFVLVALAGIWWWAGKYVQPYDGPEESPPEMVRPDVPEIRPAIAVLPFADLSADSDQAYFAFGMAEEVLHQLARNPSLRVIARTSSFSFGAEQPDIRAIAKALNVTHVLEGSVRKDGGRIRVTAQLINADDASHIWSETFDARLEEILDLQYEIAGKIVEAMAPRMGAEAGHSPRGAQPADPKAYDLYLEGRYYLDKFEEDMVRRARDRFQQALDIDPGYGAAWAGLADTFTTLGYLTVLSPEETARMTRAAAERALSIDSELASAHAALATVLTDYYYEWSAAEAHFQKAIELNPNYATAYQLYAEYLRDMGRFDEGMTMIAKARELAPLSAFNRLVEGIILDLGRRHEEAIEHYELLLKLHPDFRMTHFYLGLAHANNGNFDEALARMDKVDPTRRFPDAVACRGAFLAALGRADEARAVLAELDALSRKRYVSPFLRAIIHVPLGEYEQAIDLLEQAVDERSWFVRLFGIAAGLNPLRGHPRFQDLLESVGLDTVQPADPVADTGAPRE